MGTCLLLMGRGRLLAFLNVTNKNENTPYRKICQKKKARKFRNELKKLIN